MLKKKKITNQKPNLLVNKWTGKVDGEINALKFYVQLQKKCIN